MQLMARSDETFLSAVLAAASDGAVHRLATAKTRVGNGPPESLCDVFGVSSSLMVIRLRELAGLVSPPKTVLPEASDEPDKSIKRQPFTVAFSFPGERREYVQCVDDLLCSHLSPNEVFYDRRYEHELARPNLDTYLQDIYLRRSRLVVVFVCREYAEKPWCGLEWRAIRDIIKRRRDCEVMPFRFDDAEIPGLFSGDGYIDARTHTPEQAVALIIQRIQSMDREGPRS
jgi:hypothetical protein